MIFLLLVLKFYQNDIQNFTQTLKETLLIDPEVRRQNAYKARRALDKLRPKYIKEDWINLLVEITTGG